MGAFGAFLGEGFVVEGAGGDGGKGQVELVFPAEFEGGLRQGIVSVLDTGVGFEAGGEFACIALAEAFF